MRQEGDVIFGMIKTIICFQSPQHPLLSSDAVALEMARGNGLSLYRMPGL